MFEKILSFLRIRTAIAGLEISDQVLRLVSFNGKMWQLYAVRLAPGVLERGKVKNRTAFAAALAELKEKVEGRRKGRPMNVVACLSSAEIYTQTFSLPMAGGKELEQAIALNLKMAAPSGDDTSYSDWQLLGRDSDTGQTKILAAFIDRAVADELATRLFEAGFLPMAVESRALAFTRVLRAKGTGVEATKSYLFVDVDNTGLDFLILRNGLLAFEYAEPWRDIMNGKGEIAVERFKAVLKANTRQVVNFYRQHWTEPLAAVILSTPILGSAAEEVVAEAVSSIPVVRLTLVMGQPISPEWLMAVGASLRSRDSTKKGKEISLLGDSAQDRFREEQLLNFLRFWRVTVPVTLGVLVLMFGLADFFLHSVKTGIESRSDFNIGASERAQIAALEASAKSFNQSTALIAAAESETQPKSVFLNAIMDAAASDHITVSHVVFQSPGTPVVLTGSGLSEDDVVAFKTALAGITGVSKINLPLTGIQTNGNSVSFSVTFLYTPPEGSQ